jgi:translocation and assembly module TamB
MADAKHIAARAAIIVLSVIAVILIIGVIAIAAITNTDRGRAEVLRFALGTLNNTVDGEVRVDRLEGNLMRGLRLINVAIVDDEGEPLILADTASTGFSALGLIRQRIILSDLRFVNARLTLNETPGRDWNFVRIFQTEPDTVVVEEEGGWGRWVELRNVELVNADVVMRSTYKPSEDLTPAEQEAALHDALSEESRMNVVAVEGGYQTVMEFHELNALIERVLIAHPDTHGIPIDIERFNGIVQPFKPPAADIRGLSGNFRIKDDSLFFRNVRASLPGSDLSGEGAYAMGSGQMMLRLSAPSVALNDLRWLYPPLPDRGGGSLELSLFMGAKNNHILAYNVDLSIDESAIAGRTEFVIGDTLYFGDTDLEFDNLDTRLIAQMAPDVAIPRHGYVNGHAAFRGSTSSMRVNADVRFDDHAGGASRVLASGHLGMDDGFETRGIRIQLAPLQADLVRAFAPDAPINGQIEGFAEITGAMPGPLQLSSDLTLRDPRTGVSRVLADGGIDMRDELRLLGMTVTFSPVRLDLARAYAPQLPAGGVAEGRFLLDGYPQRDLRVDGALSITEPGSGTSRVAAAGRVAFGDELRFSDFRLRLDPLRLDLARGYAPDVPAGTTITGPIRLHGVMERGLVVDSDLAIHEPASGTSRIQTSGAIVVRDGIAFRNFAVRTTQLQMAIVRSFDPTFPLGGVLSGSTVLNGDLDRQLGVQMDLTHVDGEELSAIRGDAMIGMAPGRPVRADLIFEPLSLTTAGRFAPSAGLRGEASGHFRATGTFDDILYDADLTFDHGGRLTSEGRLGLDDPLQYDIALVLDSLDLAAISTQAPDETVLTGTAHAQGRGTDPATMTATVRADFEGLAVGEYGADEIRLRLAVDDGLVSVNESVVRLSTAEARFDGDFGLTADRSGTLRYSVSVDSLHHFATLVPAADTAVVVPPRPAVREVALEQARERMRQALDDAHVEFIATGYYPNVIVDVDTVAIFGIPSDSLAGSIEASGRLSGNIARFDADGEVEVENLLFAGNYVEHGLAKFDLQNVGEENVDVELDVRVENALAGGFALEEGRVDIDYRGMRFGEGRARIELRPDDDTDLVLDSEFALSLDGNEVRLQDLSVRLDSVRWQSAQPGAVSWSDAGIEIRTLELRRATDLGRIWIDGMIATEGESSLEVELENVEIGHIVALLQDDSDAEGRLDLDLRMNGTLDAPRLEGSVALRDPRFDGDRVPGLRLDLEYGDRELGARGEFLHEGAVVAELTARVPIDLSANAEGPRLLDSSIEVDLVAAAFPLETIEPLVDAVSHLDGTLSANIQLRGTTQNPVVDGEIALAADRLALQPLGTEYERITGSIRLEDNVVRVDSIVAWSTGPIRIAGEINLTSLSRPELDLDVEARRAWVIRTVETSLQVDADLGIVGPIDGVQITGDVRTRRGVIIIPGINELAAPGPIDLEDEEMFARADPLLRLQRDAVLAQSELVQNLEVDIAVIIDRDVWLRSTEANIEIYTPPEIGPLQIHMRGIADELRIEGTINTDRGEYEYLSRRFRLTRGALTFQGGDEINPIVQLAAEHEVNLAGRESFDIRIVISGTAQELDIELESTAQPPISQTDLLSFLAFGREASSMMQQQGSSLSGQGGASGGLVGNVAGLAAQQYVGIAMEAVVNELERDAARAIGLDVIRITPAPLPPEVFTGSYLDVLRGTEIEAGSYLTSRMFVAGQVRPTFAYPGLRFEYQTPTGFEWVTSFRPRYVTVTPTLRSIEPERSSVFGSFVYQSWRF